MSSIITNNSPRSTRRRARPSSHFPVPIPFDSPPYPIASTGTATPDILDESHALPSSPSFACPFYKFNPQVYDECKKHRFPRISDIKQHLIRRHSLPPYFCPACWISFMDEQSRIHHPCRGEGQYELRPEGLSPEEIQVVRLIRGGSSEAQWFAIWRRLFPGYTEPQSPYIQPNNIEEVVSLLSPYVEAVFHASLPSLPSNELGISSSFVTRTLTDACQIYFQSLPASRHDSPPLPPGCPIVPREGRYLFNGMPLNDGNDIPISHAYPSHMTPIARGSLRPPPANAIINPAYWLFNAAEPTQALSQDK
ncbi:unnamed protein product [Clonostachys chloroleuca]|uniref:C2H2-type domain-containing protein n=1 Tax=Clonostachys chloroleuca TaxID=1926264 RepID=A0AA35M5R0_9HYPO|nr:unnamed protein product [Clonostachys chloroleuca]